MKKLMIAAAAAMIGFAAQAVSVSWTLGYITDAPEAGGWGATMLSGDSTLGYTAVLSLYTDSGLSDLVTSSSTSEWGDGIAMGYDEGTVLEQKDAVYYGQLVVSNDKGQTLTSQTFTMNTWALSDAVELTIATDPSMIGNLDPVGGDWNETYGAFSASGWTAAAVPEPTSGLLLLLGVAGLALRRRRA